MVENFILQTKNIILNLFTWDSILLKPEINGYELIGILYNFVLLLIPYYICRYLSENFSKGKINTIFSKIIAMILGFIWLLFIPNTAYIISDVRHLVNICYLQSDYHVCSEGVWLIFFFFAYATFGWITMYYLVDQMKELLLKMFGEVISRIYLICILPLISLGLLIGLVQRWNSYEFFLHPIEIIKDLFMYITEPTYLFNWVVVTLILGFLYWLAERIFKNKISI